MTAIVLLGFQAQDSLQRWGTTFVSLFVLAVVIALQIHRRWQMRHHQVVIANASARQAGARQVRTAALVAICASLLVSMLSGFLSGGYVLARQPIKPPAVQAPPQKVKKDCTINLVIDASQSMSEFSKDDPAKTTKLESAKQAARQFVQANQDCSFGVIGFGSNIVGDGYPTLDKDKVLKAIDSIDYMPGGTLLGEAVKRANQACEDIKRITVAESRECRIVVISDGNEEIDEENQQKVTSLEELLGTDEDIIQTGELNPIYTIGVSISNPTFQIIGDDGTPVIDDLTGNPKVFQGDQTSDFNDLKMVASASGGKFATAEDVDGVVNQLNNIDYGQYEIGQPVSVLVPLVDQSPDRLWGLYIWMLMGVWFVTLVIIPLLIWRSQ